MLEFFRGWKHKVGCATLVMACLLMVGWVRSLFCIDFVTFPDINRPSDSVNSYQGKLMCMRVTETRHKTSNGDSYKWHSYNVGAQAPGLMINTGKWKWYVLGFGHRQFSDEWKRIDTHAIPYWSIVLPLTAISAGLLLSKPRAKIESLIAENGKP